MSTTAITKFDPNQLLNGLANQTRTGAQSLTRILAKDGASLGTSLMLRGKDILSAGTQIFLKPYSGLVNSGFYSSASKLMLGSALPGPLRLVAVTAALALGTYSTCKGLSHSFSGWQTLKNKQIDQGQHGITYDFAMGGFSLYAGLGALAAVFCPVLGVAPVLAATLHATVPLLTTAFGASWLMENFAKIAHNKHWLVENSYWGIFSPLKDPKNGFLSPLSGIYHYATHGIDEQIWGRLGVERGPSSIQEANQKNLEYKQKMDIAIV